MDDIKKILGKRAPAKRPDSHLHSAAHVLADEISTAFGERKRFAMYLGTINRVGVDKARQIYRQIEQDGAKMPGKLFMFLCKKAQYDPKDNEKGGAGAA